jgi:hypothetical protein
MARQKLDETMLAQADWQDPLLIPAESSLAETDKRHYPRVTITGMARMAQRSRLVRLDRDEPPIPCKILDASPAGYRVAVASPAPFGAQLALEHIDGKRLPVQIVWAAQNNLGLKIIDAEGSEEPAAG